MAAALEETVIGRRVRDLEDTLGASLFQLHPGGSVSRPRGNDFWITRVMRFDKSTSARDTWRRSGVQSKDT